MPKYVFDTGPFALLKHYPKQIFLSFWTRMDALIESGEITSTKEVLRELEPDAMYDWACQRKELFPNPDLAEQTVAAKILAKHPELVRQKNLLSGKPVADPFVIARAYSCNASVVSIESYKQNAHSIPNICEEMSLEYLHGLLGLMEKEGWVF